MVGPDWLGTVRFLMMWWAVGFFLDDKASLAFAGRYDIFTGLGCDCVTRGGDRRLTEMLGWSIGKIIDVFI